MKDKILKELNKLIGVRYRHSFILWLETSTDFFIAPCSRDHHLNVKGGLAIHSWNVYTLLKEKNKRYKLGLSKDTMIICGLLHDLCKTNFYKGTDDGYVYDEKLPLGHGEKSVILLMRYIELTIQEMCMIRWHMSGFDISPYGKSSYYNAIKMYPACLALHTADYESTIFLEE